MRIGCLRERVQVLVTRTSRHKAPRPEVLDPANRESCTVIASINAMGDSLPPWLVFAHYPTTNWAGIDIGTGVRFAQPLTGFSNAEIHLEWADISIADLGHLQHRQNSLESLEQWFGCDEHLRLPDRGMSRVERPPVNRPDEDITGCDGFTRHTSVAFAEYCIKFDIIIAILPPHSTHLMQPLDVGGNLTLSWVDFLAAFQQDSKERMLSQQVEGALRKSHEIWIRHSARSREAQRVANLLSVLFRRLQDADIRGLCKTRALDQTPGVQSDDQGLALFGEFGLLHHLEDLSVFFDLAVT
ncbi:DDE superfamily endonuclease, CENP-B-like protein, partial [Metarhizium majus ARSEF 297]